MSHAKPPDFLALDVLHLNRYHHTWLTTA